MKHLLSLAVFSFLCTGPAFGQGASDARVERLGVVDVRQLPPANPHAQRVHANPVLVDDPELFQGQKLQAQNGGSGFPAASVTETPSVLSLSSGFVGLTLADTPGYI